MSLRAIFSNLGKIALAAIAITFVAATAAHAQRWHGGVGFYAGPGYYAPPPVVVAPAPVVVAPGWQPAPAVVYQQPTTITMTCASGVTISYTGTGTMSHLLKRADHICATRYPSYAPVVVQGAPAGSNYCREYQSSVVVNGVPQQSYGTACLQPGGTWRIRN